MILGSFYFRQTNTGNLTGEFCNIRSRMVNTESADINSQFMEGFLGRYSSTWFEEGAQTMSLLITAKEDTIGIFRLEWSSEGRIVFYGEGFLLNETLVGSYWDSELQEGITDLFNQ